MNQTNNKAHLIGVITKEATYSHETAKEKFFQLILSVKRLSGIVDTLPVIVSEILTDVSELKEGLEIEVKGAFRSHNIIVDGKKKVLLYIFSEEITILKEKKLHLNEVELTGRICREPVYRKTISGRGITDLLLAVNRKYTKADFIPVICWNRNAKLADSFLIGTGIHIRGRIQSRDYISKSTGEKKNCYEVSVESMEETEG